MPKKDSLSDQEIEELLNACKTDRERFIITILIYTGLRVDELAHMKGYWIDTKKELINVPDREGDWTPKTKHGVRSIPVVESRLKFALNRFFKDNDEVGMTRTTIWRIVRKVAERTSIKRKVYPHALRSTFASILAYKGISEGTMCSIMGWSNIKTAQAYVKLSGKRAKEELTRKW